MVLCKKPILILLVIYHLLLTEHVVSTSKRSPSIGKGGTFGNSNSGSSSSSSTKKESPSGYFIFFFFLVNPSLIFKMDKSFVHSSYYKASTVEPLSMKILLCLLNTYGGV